MVTPALEFATSSVGKLALSLVLSHPTCIVSPFPSLYACLNFSDSKKDASFLSNALAIFLVTLMVRLKLSNFLTGYFL